MRLPPFSPDISKVTNRVYARVLRALRRCSLLTPACCRFR